MLKKRWVELITHVIRRRNRWVLIPKTEAPGEKAAKTGGLLLAGTSTESPTLKRQVDDNEFHS